MLGTNPSMKIASSYVFRQACGVFLQNHDGERYNGETQQECMPYLEMLLDHLDKEEINQQTEGIEAPSLVRKIFGLKAATKVIRDPQPVP